MKNMNPIKHNYFNQNHCLPALMETSEKAIEESAKGSDDAVPYLSEFSCCV